MSVSAYEIKGGAEGALLLHRPTLGCSYASLTRSDAAHDNIHPQHNLDRCVFHSLSPNLGQGKESIVSSGHAGSK